MADNLIVDEGTGTKSLATQDVSNVHHQKMLLEADNGGTPALLQGTTANGLEVDVTRVSGNVTVVDGGGSLTVDSAQLPAALGQTTKANSLAVVLASNQDALPVTDNGGSLTVDGPLTDAQLRASAVPVSDGGGAISIDDNGSTVSIDDGGSSVSVDDNGGSLTVDSAQLPAALGASGGIKVENMVQPQTTRVSGNVAAPAANAVIADTGVLAAGTYMIEYSCAAMDTLAVGKGMILEHRNAANSATLNTLGGCVAGESQFGNIQRITLAASERIRIIAGPAAGAASSRYIAHIGVYPVH